MAQDTSNSSPSTPVGTADVANASALVESVSVIRQALSTGSDAIVTAITAIATAVTQKLMGGVVGTTTNRLLKSKTVSSRVSAGSLQASGVTCDSSDNLSGIGNLDMTGTLTAATLNPTNPLAINKGGTANVTAAAAFDALAPTSAQGDVIYRNATTNTALVAGTSGQFLKTQGAGANPVWADVSASSKTTIASGSLAANNIGVAITSIPATYNHLILQITGASTDTATRTLYIQVSTDNSTYDTTAANYTGYYTDANTGGATPFIGSSAPTLNWGIRNAAATTVSVVCYIWGYQGSNYCWSTGVQNPSTGDKAISFSSYIGSTSAIQALRVIVDGTGAFDAGTYALYGVT